MTARPPLLLHVGSHKTGTTAMQAALAALRPELARAGIAYPDLKPELGGSPRDHNALAHALAAPDLRTRLALWRAGRQLARAARHGQRTILSAEAILRHVLGRADHTDSDAWFAAHRAYLRRIARYLGRFNITALCYFRQPETAVISLYKENIIRGLPEARLDLAGFLAVKAQRFDYPRHIAALQASFPQTEILSFEAEVKTGLLTGFLRRVGAADLAPPVLPDLRTSPSNRAALWLQRHIGREDALAYRARATFALRAEAAPFFAEDAPSTLWPDAALQERFFQINAESYALPFLQPPRLTDLPPTRWSDTMHARADAGFADWAAAHADLLARRNALRLRPFHPDP